jgi:uncharacterized protein YjiS (DUF1127 family)
MERMMAYSLCPAPSAMEHQTKSANRTFIAKAIGGLNILASRFARFLAVRRERAMLLQMSDELLSDIGITRAQAEEEYRKSFKLR